jgi:hypothetical protein
MIAKFYIPLAFTSIVSLTFQPVITLFLGWSRSALVSLAVFPVVNFLLWVFRSIGISFREIAIVMLDDRAQNYYPLRNFAILLGLSTTLGLSLIAFTTLFEIWFHNISGLSLEICEFARFPIQILSIVPALEVLLSFQRAILVRGIKTRPISWSAAVEIIGIIVTIFVFIKFLDTVGILAAAIAIVLGRIGANVCLISPCLDALNRAQSIATKH